MIQKSSGFRVTCIVRAESFDFFSPPLDPSMKERQTSKEMETVPQNTTLLYSIYRHEPRFFISKTAKAEHELSLR